MIKKEKGLNLFKALSANTNEFFLGENDEFVWKSRSSADIMRLTLYRCSSRLASYGQGDAYQQRWNERSTQCCAYKGVRVRLAHTFLRSSVCEAIIYCYPFFLPLPSAPKTLVLNCELIHAPIKQLQNEHNQNSFMAVASNYIRMIIKIVCLTY